MPYLNLMKILTKSSEPHPPGLHQQIVDQTKELSHELHILLHQEWKKLLQ
jgi:hypothetical protein